MRLQGYIYGEGGASIASKVSLFDPATKSIQHIDIAPGEQYTIDGVESEIESMQVMFSAPGYQQLTKTVADLIFAGGDVTLKKSNILLPVAAVATGLLLMKKQKKVAGISNDVMPLVVVGGGLLAIHMVSRILDKLGLGGDPTASEQANPDSAFSPTYWRQFTTFTYSISLAQADSYAQTIYNAFTIFQDDFNAIMGVFQYMRTKANVSYLSDIFIRKYSESLLPFLTDGGGLLPWDGLSKDNLNKILSYVSKLPTN